MQLIENARALKSVLKIINNGKNVGFVPTMGSLHQGHLQLVKQALAQNEHVIVSIFVNKRQFNDASDFEKYPKSLQKDCDLLQTLSDQLIIYAPASPDELFLEDFISISVDLNGIENELEGEHRPGHFQGVIDVVHQLFQQVQPVKAYFGEKDFQQLAVIRRLSAQHFPDLEIIGVPTSRSESGLALSSRNALLGSNQLETAKEIHISLNHIAESFRTQGPAVLKAESKRLENLGFKIDYITVANSQTLKAATTNSDQSLRVFAAVFLGSVRLIDNVAIKA
jgi:pantoate--beta-alanine ligase